MKSLFAKVTRFVILVTVTGCAVGPDFKPPQNELTPAFSESTGYQQGEVVAAWWKNYNDPVLDELIDRSIKGNKDLEAALARLNESRALRRESALDLIPHISAEAGYTSSLSSNIFKPPLSRDDRTTDSFRSGFDTSWEMDFFGRVRRQIEQSRANELASEAALHDLMRTLSAEVAVNYFELRGAQKQLEVAKRNANNQEATIKLIEAQAASGHISELDAAQARAQLNITLATVPPFETGVRQAMHRLAVLMGEQSGALNEVLKEPKALPSFVGPVEISSPDLLLKRRPDIIAAEHRLHSSVAGIGVAEGDLFPRVTFNGTLALQARSVTQLGDSGADTYSFGPSISWAFLGIGTVITRVQAADARAAASLAEYQQSVLIALEEVDNSLVRYSREQERLALLRAALQQSSKASGIAELQYREGLIDFLTVLVAQRVELQTESDVTRSQTDLNIALVSLYKALGGGWDKTILAEKTVPSTL